MYVNALITLQENASTYGAAGKSLMGHVTLSSPGYIMCYIQNLKKQSSDVVYGLYVFNKAKAKGVRIGQLKDERESRWLVNEKNIDESSLRLDEIDGVAVVAENLSRGTEMVMSGFKEGRFMIIPIIEEIYGRLKKPPRPKPGPPMPPPPKPGPPMPPPPKPGPPMPPPPKPGPPVPPPPKPGPPVPPPPKPGPPMPPPPKPGPPMPPPPKPGPPMPPPPKPGPPMPPPPKPGPPMPPPPKPGPPMPPPPKPGPPVPPPPKPVPPVPPLLKSIDSDDWQANSQPRQKGKVILPDDFQEGKSLGPLKDDRPGNMAYLDQGTVISAGTMGNQQCVCTAIPEGPGPVIEEGMKDEKEPVPIIPEGPGPVIEEGMKDEKEPVPIIPEGPGPVIEEGMTGEKEPVPIIPEEPGPVILEGKKNQEGPGPVILELIKETEVSGAAVSDKVNAGQMNKINNMQSMPEGETLDEGIVKKVKILDQQFKQQLPGENLQDVELIKVAETLEEPEKKPAVQKSGKSGIPFASTNIPNASVVRDNEEENENLRQIIARLKEDTKVCEKTKSIESQIEKMQSIPQMHKCFIKSNVEQTVERNYISKQDEESFTGEEEEEEERDSSPRNAHQYLAEESGIVLSGDLQPLSEEASAQEMDESSESTAAVDYLSEIEKKIREITEKRKQETDEKNN